jgi:uncharacterized membrane protein HdeD (DUF308 family)
VVQNASQEASDQPASAGGRPISRVGGWVGSSWRTAFTVGIVTLLIGIIVVAWPEATIGVFAVLFGVQLFLLGIFNLVRSIAAHDAGGGERVLYALSGILSIIVGVLAMRHLLQTAEVMAILFGLTWLVGGIIELVNALSGSARRGGGWVITLSILTSIAGLIVLAYPAPSLVTLTILTGTWFIIWGAFTAVLAFRARSADA